MNEQRVSDERLTVIADQAYNGYADEWDGDVHDEIASALRELQQLRAENARLLEVINGEFHKRGRIGPDTPDNSMVICPHCTSQFQAIPGCAQKDIAELKARVEAAEWRPIETRPNDGMTTYLITDGKMVAPWIRGVIHNNPGTNYDWNYGEKITHWMPLPPPPNDSAKGDGK